MGGGVSYEYSNQSSLRLKILITNPNQFNLPNILENLLFDTKCEYIDFSSLSLILEKSGSKLSDVQWNQLFSILGISPSFKINSPFVKIRWKGVVEYLKKGVVGEIDVEDEVYSYKLRCL